MSELKNIYTLTGNLLAERTLEYDSWSIGKTGRATRESFNTRGKGVNVSNMLARLGTASTALIFSGGPSGAESEAWLRQRGINYQAFATLAASRTGTVIWSDRQAETTFLGPNVTPDAEEINACAVVSPDGTIPITLHCARKSSDGRNEVCSMPMSTVLLCRTSFHCPSNSSKSTVRSLTPFIPKPNAPSQSNHACEPPGKNGT